MPQPRLRAALARESSAAVASSGHAARRQYQIRIVYREHHLRALPRGLSCTISKADPDCACAGRVENKFSE